MTARGLAGILGGRVGRRGGGFRWRSSHVGRTNYAGEKGIWSRVDVWLCTGKRIVSPYRRVDGLRWSLCPMAFT